ncbi:hypothetical protein KP509_1Z263200 [Ceratopteris richardii]|nr:hypothetical protein KP509_1Z263200 [Ceratopteris richardii]
MSVSDMLMRVLLLKSTLVSTLIIWQSFRLWHWVLRSPSPSASVLFSQRKPLLQSSQYQTKEKTQTSKQASSFSLISTTFVLSKANLLFSQECSVFSLVHLCLIQLQAPGRLLPQWKHQLQFTLDPLLIHPQRRRSPFRSFMSSSVCTYICVPNMAITSVSCVGTIFRASVRGHLYVV